LISLGEIREENLGFRKEEKGKRRRANICIDS